MIIATTTHIALRCPVCGKFGTHKLSLFDFNSTKTVHLTCECGTGKIIIGTKNLKQFWLQIPCILCDAKHIYYYSRQELFNNEIAHITCKETKLDLGFIGVEELVLERAKAYTEEFENLFEDMDYEEYFSNADIMVEVLTFLHDLAEEGYLFCSCGNYHIDVDILPDRLELCCTECQNKVIINANNEQDLRLVQEVDLQNLVGRGFMALGELTKFRPTSPRRWNKTKH